MNTKITTLREMAERIRTTDDSHEARELSRVMKKAVERRLSDRRAGAAQKTFASKGESK